MSDDGGTGGESSSSSTEGESAPKRSRYACAFRPDSNTYTWAKVSRKGPSFAYCTLCSRDVSVAYGGTKDLRKHEQTAINLMVFHIMMSGYLWIFLSGFLKDIVG